ncbi:MAG: hypothetical protein WBA43_12690 [Elainellaceae cyanobacterium]
MEKPRSDRPRDTWSAPVVDLARPIVNAKLRCSGTSPSPILQPVYHP